MRLRILSPGQSCILETWEPEPLKLPAASSGPAWPSRPAPAACLQARPGVTQSPPGTAASGSLAAPSLLPARRPVQRSWPWPSLLLPPRSVTTTPSLPRARTPPELTGALTHCVGGRPGHPDPPPWGPGPTTSLSAPSLTPAPRPQKVPGRHRPSHPPRSYSPLTFFPATPSHSSYYIRGLSFSPQYPSILSEHPRWDRETAP